MSNPQKIPLTPVPVWIPEVGSLELTLTPAAPGQSPTHAAPLPAHAAQSSAQAALAPTHHAQPPTNPAVPPSKPVCTCYWPGKDMKFHHFCPYRCCKRRFFEDMWRPHPDHLPVCHWYCFNEMRDKLVEAVMEQEGKLQVDGVEDASQVSNVNLKALLGDVSEPPFCHRQCYVDALRNAHGVPKEGCVGLPNQAWWEMFGMYHIGHAWRNCWDPK